MKNLFFLCVIILSCRPCFSQKTIFLDDGHASETIKDEFPTRNVKHTNDGAVITYQFRSIVQTPNNEVEGTYYLKVGGFGQTTLEGKPALPMRWDSFVFPHNSKVNVSVIDSTYIDIPIKLSPARLIIDKDSETRDWQPIKPYSGMLPLQIATIVSSRKYKDQDIISVCVSPVQYNYVTGTARLYSRIVYKINCKNAKSNLDNDVTKDSLASYDSFLNNITLNYRVSGSGQVTRSTTLLQQDYLILAVTEHDDAVRRFADWKRMLGFNVHVEERDSGEWTTSNVRSTIDSYKNIHPNMAYLLFIGDHEHIPAEPTGTPDVFSDYYYLNSSNEISPISHGRLSISSATEANVVVDKIINYERVPVTDSTFYNKGMVCSYFQDRENPSDPLGGPYELRRFVLTSEEIRNYLSDKGKSFERIYFAHDNASPQYWNSVLSNGGQIPIELQKPNFSWDGDKFDIISGINSGKFMVIHRDHGGTETWRDPWFHKENISSLTNGKKLPIVFSINCETGKFSFPECFSERFLRKDNGGCVAIYAFSGDSYSAYGDALLIGMVDAIWPVPGLIPQFPNVSPNVTTLSNPIYRLGGIMKQGLIRMAETWGSDSNMSKRFHCFGDPSMMITTDVPTVFANTSISRSSNMIMVNTGGEDATISFYNKQTDAVTAYNGTNATYNGNNEDVAVCISAHNKIPFISDVLYLQNENISGSNQFTSDIVKVGYNVTNKKTEGNVVFQSGHSVIIGNDIELRNGVEVQIGAKLEINTQ